MKKSITICIAVVLVVISILFICLLKTKTPIKDQNISFNVGFYNKSSDIKIDDLNWYKNEDEAFSDFSAIEDTLGVESINELCFEYEQYNESLIRRYYSIPKRDGEGYRLIIADVLVKEDTYSQVFRLNTDVVNLYDIDNHNVYDVADATVQSILFDYASPICFKNNSQEQVYHGYWNNKEELETMTIAGKPLSEVIELDYPDGVKYYMWISQISDVEDKILGIDGELTYRKVIEALGIEI